MFHIDDAGDGSRSSIAVASPYECEAAIYEWDDATQALQLAYDLQLTRSNVTVTAREDQFHPAVAVVSNDTGSGAVELIGSLRPGVVIATAPVMVISQNGDINLTPTIRAQNGGTTTSIITESDETLMLGWTPENLKTEIREDENGLLRWRKIDAAGAVSWVLT